MPGSAKEVTNARAEGVEFQWNLQPLAIEVDSEDRVTGVKMIRTEMGKADDSGRRRPEIVQGSEHVIEADAVIQAFGFRSDPTGWLSECGVEHDERGRVKASVSGQSSHQKVFAGGDVVRGSDLVVTAIADGRNAAEAIIDFLDV